jgi:hypothetical protein
MCLCQSVSLTMRPFELNVSKTLRPGTIHPLLAWNPKFLRVAGFYYLSTACSVGYNDFNNLVMQTL